MQSFTLQYLKAKFNGSNQQREIAVVMEICKINLPKIIF